MWPFTKKPQQPSLEKRLRDLGIHIEIDEHNYIIIQHSGNGWGHCIIHENNPEIIAQLKTIHTLLKD